jgi:hypothetical protein
MPTGIAALLEPKGLDYYRVLTRNINCSIELTRDESAMVLKAYDRGIAIFNQDEAQLLDAVMAKLKTVIHP